MLQINQARLIALMRDFYTLTQIRIVLFDNEYHELLAYPEKRCAFCEMIRSKPAFLKKCMQSDATAFNNCVRTNKPIIYSCSMGLTEAVIPIKENHVVYGYVMFGQILPSENEQNLRMQLKANQTLAEFSELDNAVQNIVSKNSAEIRAAATILETLTLYLLSFRLVTPPKEEFVQFLNHYIDLHLSEAILVEELCTVLGVGRTRLYEIASPYLGCGISEYVRKQRIVRAKELLTDSRYSIADIASMTGFEDYNYFSRVFKQETGMCARQFRSTKHSILSMKES